MTSILFFIFILILENEWFRYMKFVFRFSFLNWKTNGCLGTRIFLNVWKKSREIIFLVNWNTKLEIKLWFSFLYRSWDIKHQTKWFFNFKSNWTLKFEFELRFSFLILIWKTENEKPNILKQISYETSYHLPYAITINKYKRIK